MDTHTCLCVIGMAARSVAAMSSDLDTPEPFAVLSTTDCVTSRDPRLPPPSRAGDHRHLLGLHRSRGSSGPGCARARPSRQSILAEDDIAFTARGRASVVEEAMAIPSPEYVRGVAIAVEHVDDHRQPAFVVDSGVGLPVGSSEGEEGRLWARWRSPRCAPAPKCPDGYRSSRCAGSTLRAFRLPTDERVAPHGPLGRLRHRPPQARPRPGSCCSCSAASRPATWAGCSPIASASRRGVRAWAEPAQTAHGRALRRRVHARRERRRDRRRARRRAAAAGRAAAAVRGRQGRPAARRRPRRRLRADRDAAREPGRVEADAEDAPGDRERRRACRRTCRAIRRSTSTPRRSSTRTSGAASRSRSRSP